MKINYKRSKEHIDKTYEGHYNKNKFQATEFIMRLWTWRGFCIGNILKYVNDMERRMVKIEQTYEGYTLWYNRITFK